VVACCGSRVSTTMSSPLAYPYWRQHHEGPARFELLRDFTFTDSLRRHHIRPSPGGVASLTCGGLLTIRAGYRWDLGTHAIDDPAMIVASLEHDLYCDLVTLGALPAAVRPSVDAIFRRRLQQYSRSGWGRAWAWTRWAGVVLYRRVKRHTTYTTSGPASN